MLPLAHTSCTMTLCERRTAFFAQILADACDAEIQKDHVCDPSCSHLSSSTLATHSSLAHELTFLSDILSVVKQGAAIAKARTGIDAVT